MVDNHFETIMGGSHTRFSTKKVWTHVRDNLEKEISRVTVYHFLDNIADNGIIRFDMASGRGGMRVLFNSELTEMEFRKMISENLVQGIRCARRGSRSHSAGYLLQASGDRVVCTSPPGP